MNPVEFLRFAAQAVATVVEAVGVAIVAVAVLLAAGRYIRGLLGRVQPFPPEGLRLGLGRSLALSLEFLLGADILRTAVEPSWDEIGRLAAIAQFGLRSTTSSNARLLRMRACFAMATTVRPCEPC